MNGGWFHINDKYCMVHTYTKYYFLMWNWNLTESLAFAISGSLNFSQLQQGFLSTSRTRLFIVFPFTNENFCSIVEIERASYGGVLWSSQSSCFFLSSVLPYKGRLYQDTQDLFRVPGRVFRAKACKMLENPLVFSGPRSFILSH